MVNLFVQRLQVHAVAMMSTSAVEAVAMMSSLGIRVIEGVSMMIRRCSENEKMGGGRLAAWLASQSKQAVASHCFVLFCVASCRRVPGMTRYKKVIRPGAGDNSQAKGTKES